MQKCDITGKGKQYGNNVSFSQRHTKKVWKPNLQKKTMVIDGKKVTMKISTQAIRTLTTQGLLPAPAKKAESAGSCQPSIRLNYLYRSAASG